jgi:predicted phosphohydrolase
MRLFAIGDLHLSGAVYKPMDKFGSNWKDHDRTIKEKWIRSVSEEDTVLIPGDISWAMTLDEVMIDLQYIHNLPGNKILIRGNHDYWWKSVTKLNELYKNCL